MVRNVLQQLGAALLFWALAELSLKLGVPPVLSRSVWLPAALLAGLVVLFGARFAPGLALGAGLFGAMHFASPQSGLAFLLNAFVVAVQVGVANHLLARWVKPDRQLLGARNLALAGLILGPIAGAIKAIIILPTLAMLGLASWSGIIDRVLEWITVDTITVVLFAPIVLALFDSERKHFFGQRRIMIGGLLLVATLYIGGMFGGGVLERTRVVADVQSELDKEVVWLRLRMESAQLGASLGSQSSADSAGPLRRSQADTPAGWLVLRERPALSLSVPDWLATVQARLPDGWLIYTPDFGVQPKEPRPPIEVTARVVQTQPEVAVKIRLSVPAMRRLISSSTTFVQHLLAYAAFLAAVIVFLQSARGGELELRVARNTAELQQSNDDLRMFKAMADQSTEALAVCTVPSQINDKLTVVYVNPSFNALTQYDLARDPPGSFSLIGPDTDLSAAYTLRANLLTGDPCHAELYLHRRDGSSFLADCSAFPITDRRGHVLRWVCIYRDIGNQRMHEQREIEAQRHELERQRHEQMGRMAAMLAHDFNNLMTVILGSVEMIRLHTPGSETLALLQNMEQAVNAGAEMTQQMLAFAGRGTGRIEAIDLSARLIGLHKLLKLAVPSQVNVYCRSDPRAGSCIVRMDAAQFSQVLLNLVVNAAQAIQSEGTVTVSVARAQNVQPGSTTRVRADALAEGDFVRLEVSDTGKGIPEALLARVFEPFFSTKLAGSGLGLPAIAGVVKQTGGWLEMESTPQGTRVVIYLPCATGADQQVPAKTLELSAQKAGAAHVLVVDDEAAVRSYAREVLLTAGYRVDVAIDGLDASACMQRGPVDLLIADLTMPRMGGMALIRELSTLAQRPRVIVMTGYSIDREQLSSQPSDDIAAWLQKPFTAAALLSAVRDSLVQSADSKGDGGEGAG